MTDLKDILVDAVRSASDIPDVIKDNAGEAGSLHQNIMDAAYLAFLDEQIRLCPRGAEWNLILKRRRQALDDFVGKVLIDGIIEVSNKKVYVKVDPKTKRVLYWEDWTE